MTREERRNIMYGLIEDINVIIDIPEMTKFLEGYPSIYDSVTQGHTREDPKLNADIGWGGFDYSYDLPDLPKEKDICNHFWYVTGYSPVTNEPYENCKYCDMKKEDYEDK